MRQKMLSGAMIVFFIVFSASLCSAGIFSNKSKEYMQKAMKKCSDECMATFEQCKKDADSQKITVHEMKKCCQRAMVAEDECKEEDNLKASAEELKKADKLLKKIEKAEDKCKKSGQKALKKCSKKKKEEVVECNNSAITNYRKCMEKADNMREDL